MRGSKIRVIWENANDWAKRLVVILGLFAGLTPAWLYFKQVMDDNILWYFRATKELMQYHKVSSSIDEALLIRVNKDSRYYIVLDDGVSREAMLYKVPMGILANYEEPEYFVFFNHAYLGNVALAAYYKPGRDEWYCYYFNGDYEIIYKKK